MLMSSSQHHEHDVRCPIIPVANPPAEPHKSLPPTRSSTEVAGLRKPTAGHEAVNAAMDTPISAAPTLAGDRTPPAGQPLSDATDSSPDTAGESDRDPEAGYGPDENQLAHPPAEKPLHGGGTTTTDDSDVVDWDGPDDPECPRNWPARRKVLFVVVTSGMITCVSFGSSVFAPAEHVFAGAFGVPLVVGQLGVALWVLGFFAGPIFFGPVSELFGHLLPLAVAVAGMSVFQIPIALGGNVRTVLICRF
ncbi:hypothetical protein LA080_015793 [Diaporthe eres]|nr:hypothetical protein LA080_015793 [Diaporthe eres]